jgi:transcriptional regulator GlxA family with amidase domain
MGELSRQSTPVLQLHGKLSPAASAKLRELAEEAGVKPSTLARMLLEELLPTVASVRMGLRVTRATSNGRPADG